MVALVAVAVAVAIVSRNTRRKRECGGGDAGVRGKGRAAQGSTTELKCRGSRRWGLVGNAELCTYSS
jgi:hypothetical protein